MKILYVEDEAEAREALGKYLKRRYGKIYTAVDGEDGLASFMEHSPDVVIADLYMPRMDGLEMIREIRKTAPDIFVVVTSAVEDVGVILKSVDAGINKYLLKPIDPEELTDTLRDFSEQLAKRQLLEEQMTGEGKKKLEDEIKKEFAAFLKATTGKGPRDVSVFIHYDKIEITAYDASTVMEKNMIDNNQNRIIMEQYRKLFYSIKEEAICDMIREISGSGVAFRQVDISMEKGIHKIELQVLGKLGK